jgi:hypothetical protein
MEKKRINHFFKNQSNFNVTYLLEVVAYQLVVNCQYDLNHHGCWSGERVVQEVYLLRWTCCVLLLCVTANPTDCFKVFN